MKPRGRSSSTRSKRRVGPKPDIGALFRDGRAIEAALRRGVREALRDHKRTGDPIVIWKDGRVVTLRAEDIPVRR
jgi:hypothetical protein